jgi:hypothetical protein
MVTRLVSSAGVWRSCTVLDGGFGLRAKFGNTNAIPYLHIQKRTRREDLEHNNITYMSRRKQTTPIYFRHDNHNHNTKTRRGWSRLACGISFFFFLCELHDN